MEIQNTGKLKNEFIKCLVYGEAGVGKTYLCSTAPEPIIISAESGLLCLRQFNLPFIEIKTLADLQDAYNFCFDSNKTKNYQTICVDSITEIAEVLLVSEKKKTKDPRKAYGEVQDQMLSLIRQFRDLPNKHVYIAAKEGKVSDSFTGSISYGPMMTGQKLSQHVPYFFDEVFRLFIYTDIQTSQSWRVLRTCGDQQSIAKDRSGVLAELEEPNLTNIFNKILKGKN